MISTIPTSQDLPKYTQRTVLGGVEYFLRFLWNQRLAKWTLDILDQEEDEIVGGIIVVANYPLNRLVTDPRAPAGVLMAIDTTGEGKDPGLRELGGRVLLIFVEADS